MKAHLNARKPTRYALLILVATSLALPLQGALTGYLKIDDIKGESQAVEHEDEIDIHDIQWQIEQEASATGGGGGAGKVSFKDLSVAKELDKASPKLMEACATGSVIPRAVLMVRKDSGDAHLDYLVITMENVLVTSISLDSSKGDSRPSEQLSLNFEKIQVRYIPQDPATGRPQEPVDFNWDVTTNTEG